MKTEAESRDIARPLNGQYPTREGYQRAEDDPHYWENRLRTWQTRLGLLHWQVIVKLANRDALGYRNGSVNIHRESQSAVISLLESAQYDPACDFPLDLEHTLVHELLHLHFAPLETEDDTPEGIAEEQAINAIARALVGLERQTAPRFFVEEDSHA